jgi:hypothetical protein
MNTTQEKPWIYNFLLGLVLLVLAGVGLSMAWEQKTKFLPAEVSKNEEDLLQATELNQLKCAYQEQSLRLETRKAGPKSGVEELADSKSQQLSNVERQHELEDRRAALQQTASQLLN